MHFWNEPWFGSLVLNKKHCMNRKEFIKSSTMAAFAITTMGCVVKRNAESEELPESTHTGDCATTNDILGPFYRPDAPDQSDMTFAGLDGSQVIIKGMVYTDDCTTEWRISVQNHSTGEISEWKIIPSCAYSLSRFA